MDERTINELTPEELEQAEQARRERALDDAVVRVLERSPRVEIPAGFAARVAASAPPRPVISVKASRVGYRVMWASIALLSIGMFVLAASKGFGGHPQLAMALELLLFAQLAGLAVWVSKQHMTR